MQEALDKSFVISNMTSGFSCSEVCPREWMMSWEQRTLSLGGGVLLFSAKPTTVWLTEMTYPDSILLLQSLSTQATPPHPQQQSALWTGSGPL